MFNIKKIETRTKLCRSVSSSLPGGVTSATSFSNFASSFVSKALTAEQTSVSPHLPDSALCLAIRTNKVALKQAVNKHRILRNQSGQVDNFLILLQGSRLLLVGVLVRVPAFSMHSSVAKFLSHKPQVRYYLTLPNSLFQVISVIFHTLFQTKPKINILFQAPKISTQL